MAIISGLLPIVQQASSNERTALWAWLVVLLLVLLSLALGIGVRLLCKDSKLLSYTCIVFVLFSAGVGFHEYRTCDRFFYEPVDPYSESEKDKGINFTDYQCALDEWRAKNGKKPVDKIALRESFKDNDNVYKAYNVSVRHGYTGTEKEFKQWLFNDDIKDKYGFFKRRETTEYNSPAKLGVAALREQAGDSVADEYVSQYNNQKYYKAGMLFAIAYIICVIFIVAPLARVKFIDDSINKLTGLLANDTSSH